MEYMSCPEAAKSGEGGKGSQGCRIHTGWRIWHIRRSKIRDHGCIPAPGHRIGYCVIPL